MSGGYFKSTSETPEINSDEFLTWKIIYSALQAFHDSEDIVLPAVNSPAVTSPALTAPLSCSDLLALCVEEGTHGEEKEGKLVESL